MFKRIAPLLLLVLGSSAFAAKPSLKVDITGNSATATALAANPADCAADNYATAINASGTLTCATITAGALPNPSSSTLGGVRSAAAVSNQWINSISTGGVPALSQPAFSNISGSVAAAQMPALTGDVTTSAGAVATTIGAGKVTNAMLALGHQFAIVTGSAVTTTSNAASDVTGLLVTLGANETWEFEFVLMGGSTATTAGGVKWALTFPAGATLYTPVSLFMRGGSTGSQWQLMSATSGTLTSSTTWNSLTNSVVQGGMIKGVIANGANAGNLQLQFASFTNTENSTVAIGSYVRAKRTQ